MSGRARLSDWVANELERQILTGELDSEDRLPAEAEFCERLGVSRSVVRDAIQSLAARGLVEVRHGFGMKVAVPSDDAFRHALLILLMRADVTMGDVIDGRAMIETEIAPLAAANGTAAEFDEMERHLGSFAQSVSEHAWKTARETHQNFHTVLIRALHMPALQIYLEPMQELILVSSLPPNERDPEAWDVELHHAILRALRAGDRAATREAMEDHFAPMKSPANEEFRATPFRESANLHVLYPASPSERPRDFSLRTQEASPVSNGTN